MLFKGQLYIDKHTLASILYLCIIHRDSKWEVARAWERQGYGMIANRGGVSISGEENIPELESGDGATVLWLYFVLLNCML